MSHVAVADPDRRAQPLRSVIPAVRGISTGGPRHAFSQDEVRDVAAAQFPEEFRTPQLLRVFDNAGVRERRFARPLEWYVEPRGFGERNAVYAEVALELAEEHARAAIADAGLRQDQIDAVVFVSSTGISTPSLDASLITALELDPGVARLPLFGLGCAGGAGGLARASDLVRAGYEHVLLVSVELCSLTFMLGDESKANFIGTALFADGCAALVLGAAAGDGGDRATIVATHGTVLPGTVGLTGWDVVDEGLKLRLSAEIPTAMATHLRPAVEASLATEGWTLDDVDAVLVHPGGAKVITGYELALGLGEGALEVTESVLAAHGNMSSPTVLFVLDEALRRGITGRALMSASGPGFTLEHLLVELP